MDSGSEAVEAVGLTMYAKVSRLLERKDKEDFGGGGTWITFSESREIQPSR